MNSLSEYRARHGEKGFPGNIWRRTLRPEQSDFVQAGHHGCRAPTYRQRPSRPDPWHRAYLDPASRTRCAPFPDCENATLPDSCTSRRHFHTLLNCVCSTNNRHPSAGHWWRLSKEAMSPEANLSPDICKVICRPTMLPAKYLIRALTRRTGRIFTVIGPAQQTPIIAARRCGHGPIGATMANQSVAASRSGVLVLSRELGTGYGGNGRRVCRLQTSILTVI